MRSTFAAALAALAAQEVASHATFQQLWHGSSCVRLPSSNSPVTNVGSRDFICNSGTRPVSGKCPVKAGGTVTIEMHQQPGDRSCANEAIGGAHYGPVQVYLTKVADASTADGSTGWFKIFSDSWSKKAGGNSGDDDNWGTRDLSNCCGRMDVPIPTDIASGDYLLRAEALALHTAGQAGGAQFYMSCYQITVEGGAGTANPATVKFPGAYSASDPGIMVNIHSSLSGYTAPGPAVYPGGTTRKAGSACTGCEQTCKVGSSPSATAPSSGGSSGGGNGGGSAPGGPSACSVQAYGQCGGEGYTGCTQCASGFTCKAVSPPYYSQCAPAS
ncbi:glyoside hydrolase [Corynascus novoguineensis]|uniref:lytic cellulose monooxygenase (C4-dehydrogenating) n=1 Tax=Corynascus novoguineensis TaxID=1126955 RepID=A0AAN7CRP8_9PEZI|nr:glyoside hydrolase [Corynascus novoguineensis]